MIVSVCNGFLIYIYKYTMRFSIKNGNIKVQNLLFRNVARLLYLSLLNVKPDRK